MNRKKMAKSRILDEFFHVICIFDERKNDIFGGKMLWGLVIPYHTPRTIQWLSQHIKEKKLREYSNVQSAESCVAMLTSSVLWFSRRAICMRMYSILRLASLNIDCASCSIFLSRPALLLYVSIMFSVPCFTCIKV